VLAQHKGYYADENLKVSFIVAKGGVDVAKQIGAGNAVIGGAIGDTPIVVRANGIPVKAIAVLGAGSVTMVAANPADGIKGLKDLKGKTVTVMSYTDTTYYAFLGSLKTAGLSKTDVQIQAAGPSGVWQLYTSGKSRPSPVCPTGWSMLPMPVPRSNCWTTVASRAWPRPSWPPTTPSRRTRNC
jgi:NitT/TauT family transport system substrate-binding protein